jgi:hypothetical protein
MDEEETGIKMNEEETGTAWYYLTLLITAS